MNTDPRQTQALKAVMAVETDGHIDPKIIQAFECLLRYVDVLEHRITTLERGL